MVAKELRPRLGKVEGSRELLQNTAQQDGTNEYAPVSPDDSSLPLAFIDGACEDDGLLRHHILAPVKKALSAHIDWFDEDRSSDRRQTALRISLFPNVPGDVLMMFDLADRNHFRQFSAEGHPYAQGFRKILVPGNWLRRQLLGDRSLGLRDSQVVSVGAPRVDYLRDLLAVLPVPCDDAPLRVLVAPMHENWSDQNGPLSIQTQLAPYIDRLRSVASVTVVEDGRNKDGKRPITEELLHADIVITDYTSVMYEAWALGKPVIFPRWLTGDRILSKARRSAEAEIYRARIGHHVDSFDELLALVGQGRALGLGDGVEAFMADYLENWRGEAAGEAVASVLTRLADPDMEWREAEARTKLAEAMKVKDWPSALTSLDYLLRGNPKEAGLYETLALVMKAQGSWRHELDALETLVTLKAADAALFTRLGDARARMGRYRAAADAYEAAIPLAPAKLQAGLYYKLGYASEAPGHDGPPQPQRASAAYSAACSVDPKSAAARFGEGALHASAGRWKQAQPAYQARLTSDPWNAELHQRLGMAHDRCYEWAEAEAAYRRALALDPAKPSWHYRLGFVLERQGRHAEAAEAYLHASNLTKTHQPDWWYRAGYCLEMAGRPDDACAAFVRAHLQTNPQDHSLWNAWSLLAKGAGYLKAAAKAAAKAVVRSPDPVDDYIKRQSVLDAKLRTRRVAEARLAHDCTRPAEWVTLSTALEAEGLLDDAIGAMEQAVLRSDDHMPAWHHRLGVLLMQAGKPEAACAAFRDQKILQRPHGTYEDKFAKDESLRAVATYREFFDVLPLMENAVLYESFGGEGCSDNPLAIFNRLPKDPRFEGWRHFWVVEDVAKAPPELRGCRDVVFVRKETQLYMRLLCTVPYLVNNATFPFYYVRKGGQEYLNTWHGTPLKTLGYDIEATPLQRANTARNLIQASMFIAPNAHTEHVMLDRYGVRNLFTGRSLQTGYPRIDMLVNADTAEKDRICNLLGLDPSKPVVLFAPTYRGHWATPELEAQSLAETLEQMKSPDYNLVFRGHYFAERFIMEMNLPVTIAPHAIDTCSLLSVVDVLVTDYSSIFYDFLITKRPVIHYVPDWDYYVETRGMYFGKDEIPGLICETEDQLLTALQDCIRDPEAQITPRYLADLERYCALEDGKASERVIEAFFFNPTRPKQPAHAKGAQHVLVHGGDLADGPQLAALRGLLAETQAQGHVNTVVVDRRVVIDDPMRMDNARALLDRADVLIRFRRACFSLEEAWVNDKIKAIGYQPSEEMRAVFEAALRHEAKRLFGHAEFDIALDFDASRPFWGNVFSAVPARSRMIRLQGDMMHQQREITPGLERIINLLPGYDRLLSESGKLLVANRDALHGADLPIPRFAALPVCLDAKDLDARAAELPRDRESQSFLIHSGLRILAFPGDNTDAVHRLMATMTDLETQDWHLAILCAPNSQAALIRLVSDYRLSMRVSILSEQRDFAPLLKAASALVVAQTAPFAAFVSAEAQQIGTPVVVLDETPIEAGTILAAIAAGRHEAPEWNPGAALADLFAEGKQ